MKSIDRLRTSTVVKWSLIGLIGLSSFYNINAAPLPEAFGVWDRGETMDPRVYPFIRGTSCDQNWNEVEKSPGVYDWSVLDKAMDNVTKEKESLFLSFECGPKTPEWVYKAGVPKVTTDDTKHQDKFPYYPYYYSPLYKQYSQRFIIEAAKHIRSYPVEVQKRIAFIQVKTGCTGDECPYKGKALNAKYDMPRGPAWEAFRQEIFALYAKLFDKVEPKISLLFNCIAGEAENGEPGKYPEAWKWVSNNITGGLGSKTGALSRGHHLSGELTDVNTWHRYLVDPQGLKIFAISEMDQSWQKPAYQLNVRLGFYWGAINALNLGQSLWDVTKGAIEVSKEQGFDYSFYFFNKYAGQIYPKTATDAFCALHKGLNYADTKQFPEDSFGKASHGNLERAEKICAAFAKYGARIDDKAALEMGQVVQRDEQKGYNDAGWDIWPDNYSRFLTQIDADATSIPLWRVGGTITKSSSIYARFARGFEHASGKDAMYFQLHDGFSADNKPKVMTINVVWYDAHAGSTWKLEYDAGAKTMKTGLVVTGKGDKEWHHSTVTLSDAVLFHGGTRGSDLALVNTDDKDDIFSIIEVHRGPPAVPELLPPTEFTISDQAPKPPKGSKNKGGK
jgi:Beta-galactosidase